MPYLRSHLAPFALLLVAASPLLGGCGGDGGSGPRSAFAGTYEGSYEVGDQPTATISLTVKRDGKVAGIHVVGDGLDTLSGKIDSEGHFTGTLHAGDATGNLDGHFSLEEGALVGPLTKTFGEESYTGEVSLAPDLAKE